MSPMQDSADSGGTGSNFPPHQGKRPSLAILVLLANRSTPAISLGVHNATVGRKVVDWSFLGEISAGSKKGVPIEVTIKFAEKAKQVCEARCFGLCHGRHMPKQSGVLQQGL